MKRVITLLMSVLVVVGVAAVIFWTLGHRFNVNSAIDIGRMPGENSNIEDISVKFKNHNQEHWRSTAGGGNNQNFANQQNHPSAADDLALFDGTRRDEDTLSATTLEAYLGDDKQIGQLEALLEALRKEGLAEHWRLDNSAWRLYVNEHLAVVLGVEVEDIAKWWSLIADNQDWQALVASHNSLDSAFWSLYRVRQELAGVYENLYTRQLLE